MKAIIVLCIVAFAAANKTAHLTPEQATKVKEYFKLCSDSTHVNPDLVAKARKGETTEDKTLDSFFDCVFKKADFIDDAGKLKTEVVKSKVTGVSEADINHVLSACSSAQQQQPKEKVAKAAYICYLNNANIKLQLLPESA